MKSIQELVEFHDIDGGSIPNGVFDSGERLAAGESDPYTSASDRKSVV